MCVCVSACVPECLHMEKIGTFFKHPGFITSGHVYVSLTHIHRNESSTDSTCFYASTYTDMPEHNFTFIHTCFFLIVCLYVAKMTQRMYISFRCEKKCKEEEKQALHQH